MSGQKTIGRDVPADEFDRMFDEGADVDGYVDWDTVQHVNAAPKRVNVDFPLWMVQALDAEAKRLGITRQALIKVWINERLERSRVA